MVGLPDRALSGVEESKARLLELGTEADTKGRSVLAPIVGLGVLVVLGGTIGRRLVSHAPEGFKRAASSFLRRAGAAAAPFLIERIVNEVASRAAARNGTHAIGTAPKDY